LQQQQKRIVVVVSKQEDFILQLDVRYQNGTLLKLRLSLFTHFTTTGINQSKKIQTEQKAKKLKFGCKQN